MRGRLLSPAMIDQLIDAVDEMAAVSVLQTTDYRVDMENGLLHHPGIEGIEDGLRRHLSRFFRKIRAVSIGDARMLVDILLGRWDIQNLKTVMRGRRVGATTQEIMDDLTPAGSLSEADLEQLASQPDIRAIIDLLGTWGSPYAPPLTDVAADYHRTQDLVPLEIALDRHYFSHALRRSASLPNSLDVRMTRDTVRLFIDVTNIITLLKMTGSPVDSPQQLYIEGGKEVSIDRLSQLYELAGIEDIIQALRDTSYGEVLEQGREEFTRTGRVFPLERAMEDLVYKHAAKQFIAHPLSIALVIGYIWAKYTEVVNLRIIMRGKTAHMPKSDIREAMLVA